MQFTLATTILALAASVSAAAIPEKQTGEYIGQLRAWNADQCGADFNQGYLKLNSKDANKCQTLDAFKPYPVQSARWEHRPAGYVGHLYLDAECKGLPTLVNDDCLPVHDRNPKAHAWKSFKIVN